MSQSAELVLVLFKGNSSHIQIKDRKSSFFASKLPLYAVLILEGSVHANTHTNTHY